MACRVSGRCGKPAHILMTSSANFFVRCFSSWLMATQFQIRTSAVEIATLDMCYLGWRESLILLAKLVEAEIPD